jgi:hypothetical protein
MPPIAADLLPYNLAHDRVAWNAGSAMPLDRVVALR